MPWKGDSDSSDGWSGGPWWYDYDKDFRENEDREEKAEARIAAYLAEEAAREAAKIAEEAAAKAAKEEAEKKAKALQEKVNQFFTAITKGDIDEVKRSISCDAETLSALRLSVRTYATLTPALVWAAHKGHIEIVDLLLKKDFKISATNKFGESALYLAVKNGNVEMVSYLLNCGAPINQQTKKNKTALHLAARKGYREIVRMLCSRGADITLKNYENKTPLEVAKDLDGATQELLRPANYANLCNIMSFI